MIRGGGEAELRSGRRRREKWRVEKGYQAKTGRGGDENWSKHKCSNPFSQIYMMTTKAYIIVLTSTT